MDEHIKDDNDYDGGNGDDVQHRYSYLEYVHILSTQSTMMNDNVKGMVTLLLRKDSHFKHRMI